MSGSIYGGTVLTITGTNFGSSITDNPVQISYNGGVGSTDCFVLTTEATQITCRIDDSISMEPNKTGEVVVFLRVSEEASCDSSVCKNFTYTTEGLPELTAITPQFDTDSYTWELKFDGINFPE